VGLDEDAVDLFEIDGAGLVADGFDEGAHAQVSCATQEAVTGPHDEGKGLSGKCVVTKAGTVKLVEEEGLDGFGSETGQESGIGDPRADFLVDGKGKGLEQRRLGNEHQVVRSGKIFAQKSELAQTVRWH